MKRYVPVFLFAAILFAVFCVACYTNPSDQNQQQCNANNTPVTGRIEKQPQCCQKCQAASSPPGWRRAVAWPEGITALGVFLTLFFIGWQAFLTREVLISSENSSQRELRAYVFPTDMHLTDGTQLSPPEPHRKDIPGVALIFKNSGKTPAYKLRTWAQIDVMLIQNESQIAKPPMQNISSHTLGTDGITTKALWYDRALNATEIAEIGNGTRGIYVHGRIEYVDAFDKARFVAFRLVFTGKIFPPTGSSYFTYCNEGNDAN